MTTGFLTLALALTTMVLAVGFAMWSRMRTLKKIENDDAPKSSLAKDGPGKAPLR